MSSPRRPPGWFGAGLPTADERCVQGEIYLPGQNNAAAEPLRPLFNYPDWRRTKGGRKHLPGTADRRPNGSSRGGPPGLLWRVAEISQSAVDDWSQQTNVHLRKT